MRDYARALVEHPKWRWEPGMAVTINHPTKHMPRGPHLFARTDVYENKIGGYTEPGYIRTHTGLLLYPYPEATDCTVGCSLDLTHPGTWGWLMAKIWERNHKAHTYCNAGVWSVLFTDAEADNPGEALATALLAALGPA